MSQRNRNPAKNYPAPRPDQVSAPTTLGERAKDEEISYAHVEFRDVEVPEATEKLSRHGWVEWGDDNLRGQFLWYLVYHSPIHGGVITSKVDFIVSGGLTYDGPEDEFALLHANGLSQYDLDEVAEMICLDNEVAYMYYLLFKLDQRTKRWYVETLDFELMRPNANNTAFYYSDDWSTSRQDSEKTGFKTYIELNTAVKNRLKDSKGLPITECVLQVKTKSRQQKTENQKSRCKLTGGFFSIPGYSGGIDAIMTDIEINFFRLAEVVNGYKGGSMLYLGNGAPDSEPARQKILGDLKLDISDRRKQGGTGVIFGEGDDQKPYVVQMNGNDLDKRYESTESGLLTKMMISHSVTNPKLFAVMSNNAMSETDDQASFDRFQKTYANKRRKSIASSLTYGLKKLNGIKGSFGFNVPSMEIEKQLDEQSEFATRLNGMSPLVANAGLSVLTDNEKRRLIWKLPPVAGGDLLPTAVQPAAIAMRAKFGGDPIIIGFEHAGRPRSEVRFLRSREHTSFDINDEDIFIASFFGERFAPSLTDLQLNILRLISEGKSSKAIQDELHLEAKDLSKQVRSLDKRGYTDGLSLTEKGQMEVVNTENVEVVYTYETRPDAPPLIGESRDFCKELLKLDRAYTRSEIDQIGKAVGRDVWRYRGGWYHNPETDNNQPSCRHYWLQNLILR